VRDGKLAEARARRLVSGDEFGDAARGESFRPREFDWLAISNLMKPKYGAIALSDEDGSERQEAVGHGGWLKTLLSSGALSTVGVNTECISKEKETR